MLLLTIYLVCFNIHSSLAQFCLIFALPQINQFHLIFLLELGSNIYTIIQHQYLICSYYIKNQIFTTCLAHFETSFERYCCGMNYSWNRLNVNKERRIIIVKEKSVMGKHRPAGLLLDVVAMIYFKFKIQLKFTNNTKLFFCILNFHTLYAKKNTLR
jgi:hypothetical protein